MAVYVLYRNGALKVKVAMDRTFTPGDKFRFDGADCVVESTVQSPEFTRVYLVDAPIPIQLDHSFPFRKRRSPQKGPDRQRYGDGL